MNAKETIEVINKTYDNTKFIIEKNSYLEGIYEVIHSWITVLFFSNAFLLLFEFISQMTGFFGKNLYYIIYNICFIIAYLLPLIIYFIKLKKPYITLKERHFLHLFYLVPVLVSCSKLLFLFSYFFNFDYLLTLYSSIPLDIIATIIGLLLLNNYLKNKKVLILCCFVTIYLIIYSTIMIVFSNTAVLNQLILFLMNLFNYFNRYSIVVILAFFIGIQFIKGKNK